MGERKGIHKKYECSQPLSVCVMLATVLFFRQCVLEFLDTCVAAQSFLSTAEKEYQAVLQLHRSAMTEFRQVAKFYGEDPQKMRLDDFFAAFADFIKNFQVCNIHTCVCTCCVCTCCVFTCCVCTCCVCTCLTCLSSCTRLLLLKLQQRRRGKTRKTSKRYSSVSGGLILVMCL